MGAIRENLHWDVEGYGGLPPGTPSPRPWRRSDCTPPITERDWIQASIAPRSHNPAPATPLILDQAHIDIPSLRSHSGISALKRLHKRQRDLASTSSPADLLKCFKLAQIGICLVYRQRVFHFDLDFWQNRLSIDLMQHVAIDIWMDVAYHIPQAFRHSIEPNCVLMEELANYQRQPFESFKNSAFPRQSCHINIVNLHIARGVEGFVHSDLIQSFKTFKCFSTLVVEVTTPSPRHIICEDLETRLDSDRRGWGRWP